MKNKSIGIFVAVFILLLASLPNTFATVTTDIKSVIINEQYNKFGINANNVDKTTIEITVNLDDFEFDFVNTDKGLFTTIELPGYGFSCEIGKAKLPMIRKMVEIPHDSNPELIVTSESWEIISLEELNLPNMILPTQPSVEKINGAQYDFNIDDKYYSTGELIPENIAKVVDIGEIRSRRFALVEISPTQYNPTIGELKLLKSCKITINLPNSDLTKTYEKIRRYSTPNFERLFEVAFSNYGAYENVIIHKEQEGYLIIVYDDFYEEIEPLADWKTSMGYNTTVIKTSEIPGGATKENIHNYIDDAYNNWYIPPAYVLLVGDTPQIPTYSGTQGPDAVDLYYVTINSEDYFPDIFIGRFPASQESHVTAMVDKTIFYEEGDFPVTKWIKKATFMAGNDRYWLTEGTHNYVISNYLEPKGYASDKLYTTTYGATTKDVIDALNDGRSLAIFSGHGYVYGWSDGPSFDQSNVRGLTNEGMYPFVCSHSCLTGSFQASECFGETWLRVADKGGIAFWGASEGTLWDEDDILEKGMFQAWWDDNLDWIGGMTDMGLIYVYENYSGGGYSKYYFEAYNILGDPSITLWRHDPSGTPDTPNKPKGPIVGAVGYEYTFSTSTIDPDGDKVYYMWDWGDGTFSEWIGPYPSGDTCEASHIWNEEGDFEVKVKAKDEKNAQSNWSKGSIIQIIYNSPPDRPEINGPARLIPKISYNFRISTIDPDGENVYYFIEWGDNDTEEWIGPYDSGQEIRIPHTYYEKGLYKIFVTAKDINDFVGETQEKHVKVSFSRNRIINNPLIYYLFEKFIESFSVLWLLL
jgi:hypothetical protein